MHTQSPTGSSAFQVVSQSPIPYPTDNDNLPKKTWLLGNGESTQTLFPTIFHFPNTRLLCVYTHINVSYTLYTCCMCTHITHTGY